jgi:hypothetical protein
LGLFEWQKQALASIGARVSVLSGAMTSTKTFEVFSTQ